MAKAKPADDGKSQYQRFKDAAREVGADGDPAAFRRALSAVAKAPGAKAKKAAKKPKRRRTR